jgi:hypothetical protein
MRRVSINLSKSLLIRIFESSAFHFRFMDNRCLMQSRQAGSLHLSATKNNCMALSAKT